jgi:NAD+-dependent secondary alcohol dehydrogenase Adh1
VRRDLIGRESNMIGDLVGSYTDLRALMALATRGLVTPSTTTYPLTSAVEAVADLDPGRLPGTRAVLVPA